MALRIKQPALIISFSTTTSAMAAERFCLERELPGRLIPIPREINSGCGLAWKALPEEEDLLTTALRENGLVYAGVHYVSI